jgi:hypothetical protein
MDNTTEVTHDIIAAVSGPGWKYGLSRILINEDNEGVVFIAGSDEPLAFFTVTNSTASRGTGTDADGNDIVWRRRGSSCQYKLAKCKVSTQTMAQRWIDSLLEQDTPLPDPDEVEEPVAPREAEEVESDGEGDVPPASPVGSVPSGSASKVMAWVGDDVDRARAALEAEEAGQQRKGLTADLQKMLDEDVL